MVKCSNCGAELPADAAFCENCGAKAPSMPAAAPPPPSPAYPTPPPAAAPPVEKKGPPMKMIAIGAAVVIIILGAVLFMASSATSGLKLTFQSGQLITNWNTGDLTVSVTLKIENPSMFGVDVTSNYLELRLKSAGVEAKFFGGYVTEMVMSVSSGGSTTTITFNIPFNTWGNSVSMSTVWLNSVWSGFSLSLSLSGRLDTKCLLFSGTSTVATGWHDIIYS